MKKIFLVIALVIVVLICVRVIYQQKEKQITGRVLSCATDDPIIGADVVLTYTGWGVSDTGGDLPWDRNFSAEIKTDSEGMFSVPWKVGHAANIIVNKEGYAVAEQNEYPQEGVIIKVLPGKSNDFNHVTFYCKPVSECLQQTDRGIENVCTHY